MELELPIEATETQIPERCMVLADAEFIAVEPADNWRCELKTRGKLYLEGKIDIELCDAPRSPQSLERLEKAKSPYWWALMIHER